MSTQKIVLRVRIFNMAFYAIICLAANYAMNLVSYWLAALIMGGVLKAFAGIPAWLFNTLSIAIIVPLCTIGSIAVLYLWFRYIIPRHYQPSDDPRLWLKNALFTILPGELIRFFLSVSDCGYMDMGALPASLVYDRWLQSVGRYHAVRQDRIYAFTDYASYTVCYLLFLALYAVLLLWVYRRLWKKAERARRDLDITESEKLYR